MVLRAKAPSAPGGPVLSPVAVDAAMLAETLAGSAGFLLGKAAQRLRELSEEALRPLGIRFHHYAVLAMLVEAGPRSQRSLGEWLAIDRTTMVELIDDLERLGLAERRRDPRDRRAYRVGVTTEGEAIFRQVREIIAGAQGQFLERLSPAEQLDFQVMLRRLCGLDPILARDR